MEEGRAFPISRSNSLNKGVSQDGTVWGKRILLKDKRATHVTMKTATKTTWAERGVDSERRGEKRGAAEAHPVKGTFQGQCESGEAHRRVPSAGRSPLSRQASVEGMGPEIGLAD